MKKEIARKVKARRRKDQETAFFAGPAQGENCKTRSAVADELRWNHGYDRP